MTMRKGRERGGADGGGLAGGCGGGILAQDVLFLKRKCQWVHLRNVDRLLDGVGVVGRTGAGVMAVLCD